MSETIPSASPANGMYFLANDAVLKWCIPFFESLREHDPDLPLVMLPFNDEIECVASLRERYRFTILHDPLLPTLDAIGAQFHPPHPVTPRYTYRKFAVFWGPFERFIFCDVDIVHLESVREFLDAHHRSGFDLLHADEEIHQVYYTEELRRQMIEQFGARGFNTGFWAARRGLFCLEQVQKLAQQAIKGDAEGFNHGTYEQPFLNYCCDVSRIRYRHFADLIPDLTRRFLAAQPGIRRDRNGVYRITDPTSSEYGKRIKFLHWAGTPANEVMPYRAIFLSYRLRAEPPARRWIMRLRSVPLMLFWSIVSWARKSDIVSRAYKRLMPAWLQHRAGRALRRK